MDEYEQIYQDEFQQSILDSGEKVTVTNLSDKYERSIKEISEALSKWVISQDKEKFQKQYILKGTHKEGYPFVTIVHEDKLQKAKASVTNPFYFLYSVELSGSSPSLDLPKLSKLKVKNLRLPADSLIIDNKDIETQVEVGESSTSVPKQHEIKPAKKPENFFKQKTVASSESKNDGQNDNTVNVVPEKTVKIESSPLESKETDKSNKSNFGPPKGNKGPIMKFLNSKPTTSVKNETKVSSKTKGGSIAALWSIKSNAIAKSEHKTNDTNEKNKISESSKVKTAKVEEESSESEAKEEKRKPPEKSTDSIGEENQRIKRALDDSGTSQEKAAKKFKVASTGRRRIVVDVDSSDEENVDIANDTLDSLDDVIEVPVVQKIEIKVQNEVMDENKVKETKQLEPLTYQDDDGFLITVKDNIKPKSAPKKVKAQSPTKKSLQKLNKIPARAATKQGAITNFFMKK